MLSPQTIQIVKETAPILEKRGLEITTHFYKRMFTHHPELLNLFNHSNQKQGRQPRALANAIYAAALHIDRLEAILPVVEQIGHKHRSVGVLAEQYPIVGENLLHAIKEVLGDAATEEVIQAWEEAYEVIADVFIKVEQGMYEEAEKQPGGWRGFRNFVVTRKVKESDVITSFYLQPEDGQPIASFKPGQYITVKMDIEGEKYTHLRQYSLSDAPGKDYYRISVKREDGDEERAAGIVSTYLHNQVKEGDILPISAPAGDFVLNMESELPVVLISGGVGQTPLLSMLNTLVEKQPHRKVIFIHAAKNGKLHGMRDQVAELEATNDQVTSFICYEQPTPEDREAKNYHKEGFITLPWLQEILPSPQADFYFCGPVPFMKAINKALKEWGVPEEHRHFEFFGPAGSLEG